MKQGDRIKCPHCHEDTFVQKKAVMDGWTKVGEIFCCALCSAKLGDVSADAEKKPAAGNKTAGLMNLLGETEAPERPAFKISEEERRFCKDCRFLVRHPFRLVCSRTDRTVEPMDDCPDFAKMETPEK